MIFALPKGRLSPGVLRVLKSAGYGPSFPGERCLRSEPLEGITFQWFKPRVIPQLIHQGLVAAGFVGLDLVVDSGYQDLHPVVNLGVGQVQIVVAARDKDILQNPPKRPLRVATEYPGVASEWCRGRGLSHILQQTYGSTEGFVPDFSDLCVDCTDTGETLAQNHLVVVDLLFQSTAWLVANSPKNIPMNLIQALREATDEP